MIQTKLSAQKKANAEVIKFKKREYSYCFDCFTSGICRHNDNIRIEK